MRINRLWLGLAVGFFGSLGFQFIDYHVKQRQWAMTQFDSVTFATWLSYYQLVMSTSLLGIVGFLSERRAIAKLEANEIMDAMKAKKEP